MTNNLDNAEEKLEQNNFNWLRRACRGPTYTSYFQFSHLPYCSFDWGENGYAGNSNHGGELLYLSAPSKNKGLIMARGHFATSLYASMSRSQIEFGGPSTFGFEVSRCPYAFDPNGKVVTEDGKEKEDELANQTTVAVKEIIQEGKKVENESSNKNVESVNKTTQEGKKEDNESINEPVLSAKNGSSFRLGSMIDRGCFNYRWPVTEYYLDLHPNHVVIECEKEKYPTQAEEDAQQGVHGAASGIHGIKENAGIDKRDIQKEIQDKQKENEKIDKKHTQNSPPAQHVGTCQMFSCAKGDTFYQVLRIEEGGEFDMYFPTDSQIVLTMGGPVWFQSFNDGEHEIKAANSYTKKGSFREWKKKSQATTDKGGKKEKVFDISVGEPTETMRYRDEAEEGRGLEAKVYQLNASGEYDPLPLTKSTTEADNGPRFVEGTTNLTAYNAIGKLEKGLIPPFNQSRLPRSATFLAVIRLFEGDPRSDNWKSKLWELPSSKELYNHVGVNPSRFHATADMWERIFLDRRAGPGPVLDLAEINMIGRSLEKILQVDYVPATFEDGNKQGRKEYGALISNRFIKGNVDLKSMFWKIRFLIKTHKFLSHIRKLDHSSTGSKEKALESHIPIQDGPSAPNQEKKADSIEEEQMNRIQTMVENVVRYLAKALLEPTLRKLTIMPDSHVPGESNYYYVMMIIWYVWKYSKEDLKDHPSRPAWKFDWTVPLAEQKKHIHPVLLQPRRLPPDNWTFASADREKVQLLQWYYYGSLLKLCNEDVLPPSWHAKDLEDKVYRLAKTAKMVSSAKLSSREPYKADDEIFDRLSFASDELGLEDLEPDRLGIIESLAMTRVKERDFTRTFNPGWLPRGEEESTSGPWEIHALCHHSRLVVLLKEEKSKQDWRTEEHTKTEAETFRHKICSFLNAEGTLVPCWERGHAKAKRGWLRSEATAVVASTLVIILEKKIPAGHGSSDSSDPAGSTSSKPTQTENTESTSNPSEQSLVRMSNLLKDHNDQIRLDEKKLLLEIQHLDGLMKGQLEAFERFTNEAKLLPPIQWMTFRPTRKYHPISFFNSLEDTPDLYKAEKLSKISIPLSLCDRISSPEELRDEGKEFTKQDIDVVLPMECLVLFDIKAVENEDDEEGFTWKFEKYKYDKSTVHRREKTKDDFLWALYDSLVDQEVQHRFLTVIPPEKSDKNPNEKSDENKSQKTSDKDSDNKKSKKPSAIPRKLLELLVYVIHPELATCLGDHILNLSRFYCQTSETWVASITLRSWRVDKKPVEKNKKYEKNAKSKNPSEISPEDFYDFRLPLNLKSVWEKKIDVGEDIIFKPEISSIVLSTNSFGDFSKCTVVSDLFPDRNCDEEMESIVNDARKLWQKFIHQPQTARCLVFFLVLGEFCKKITKHFEEAIGSLSSILNLDSTFTNSEDEYPPEFELGVWSLDALHKLQNSLNATVSSILIAKEELTAQIIDGPGKRGEKLEKMCQVYLGAFENNLVQLTAVNLKLDRRIELNTRNKDATSAVLTMRDSRTAISQNSTIQKLTYLTIGYLPIALMSAIFAIPLELNVLYVDMGRHGRSWFVGAIFIISAATYILAIFIGNVLDFFRYPPPRPGGVGKKPRSEKPPNLWKWLHLPQFLDFLDQGLHAIFYSLPEENRDSNNPEELSKDQGPVSKNEQKLQEEGQSKAMTVEYKSVSNGDKTPNGAMKP